MSKDQRQQRHHPPPKASKWLLLMKVIIAIGQVAMFFRQIFRMDE